MTLHKYLTALVGIPTLILYFEWAPIWAFGGFIAAFSLLGQWEVYGLFRPKGFRPSREIGLALGGVILAGFCWAAYLGPSERYLLLFQLMVLCCVIVVLVILVPSGDQIESALNRFASTLVGVVYVPFLMGHFVLLRALGDGNMVTDVAWVYYLLAVVWASDGGAFIVGSAIGKHPLAPQLSPKKSIEGALGGLLFAVLMSVAATAVLHLAVLSLGEQVLLGVILGALGQMGDLAESTLKRSAGVKDSGSLFPGHGGILDRADSLVVTAPVLYLYLSLG